MKIIQIESKSMQKHFLTLYSQRDTFYHEVKCLDAWKRPLPEKWSLGETLYHLLLMIRLFRRASMFYIPLMYPVAYLRRNKRYKTEIYDIYKEYRNVKKKGMSAPPLIIPPANIKEDVSEIKYKIALETSKLIKMLINIDEDIVGQIYYPDPIAKYPNVIQSIHLLAIHEQHHFDLVKKYEQL